MSNGERETIYNEGGANSYGASISQGKLYFLHSDTEQGAKSIYTYDIATKEVNKLIEGDIRTLNSNDNALFYMTASTLVKTNLDGSDQQIIGEGTDFAVKKDSPNKSRLILLTDESVYVQYRGVAQEYVGLPGPGTPEISAATTYRAPLNDLSDFHDVAVIQGYHM